MVLEIETKYNINDMVYFILKEDMYNDFYSTETVWRVKRNFLNKYEKFKINKIEVTITESAQIKYIISGCEVSEKYIFDDLDKAQKSCDILNI